MNWIGFSKHIIGRVFSAFLIILAYVDFNQFESVILKLLLFLYGKSIEQYHWKF